ncbi:MAG: hypothetical protein V4574_07980 [Pseudomonadota bacterium]
MSDAIEILARDRIQILLAEYSSLRQELLKIGTTLFQLSTLSGTALVAIIAISVNARSLGLGLGLTAIDAALYIVGIRFIDFDTQRATRRVCEVERTINEIAGEELLVWETAYGLRALGYRKRWMRILGLASN